jgi:hypothetical protein
MLPLPEAAAVTIFCHWQCAERLAAALHLPAVDPGRQPNGVSLPSRQLFVEEFPLLPLA